MEKIILRARPQHLTLGEIYLLRASSLYDPVEEDLQVTFVGYDSCPAFVYVRDETGYVGRCPRADLFVTAVRKKAGRH
jgi:hypothetical protein